MPKENFLRPYADQLVKDYKVTHDTAYHLLHAAIGTISPQDAAHIEPPIQELRENPGSSRDYNLIAAAERAEKRLNVGPVEAHAIAEEVTQLVRAAGIGVNQVQVLLDPEFDGDKKKKIFKSLCKNLQLNLKRDDPDKRVEKKEPATATLAIASKLIPSPETSWESRFGLAAEFPSRGQSELIEVVTTNGCYLWAFPPAHHPATFFATLDRCHSEQQFPSAEMGMGFSIIQAGWEHPERRLQGDSKHRTTTRYSLFTPSWSWRAQDNAWRLGLIHRSQIRESARRPHERLSNLLPRGLASLPRIHGCHDCRRLFIDETSGYEAVPTRCACDKPDETKVPRASSPGN